LSALLGVGQGEAGVDLQGLAGGVATVGWMSASSMPWVLSQVNSKWRSVCGLIEAVMPAAWVYRARILRMPRSLWGLFQLDSNRNADDSEGY
jgi:hypothetical protein